MSQFYSLIFLGQEKHFFSPLPLSLKLGVGWRKTEERNVQNLPQPTLTKALKMKKGRREEEMLLLGCNILYLLVLLCFSFYFFFPCILSPSLSIFLSHPLTLSAFDFSNWNYNINTEISSTEEKASQPAWLSASMAQWAAAIYLACSLWYREAAHEWMTDQTSSAAYCFICIAGLHLLFLESVLTQSGWNA